MLIGPEAIISWQWCWILLTSSDGNEHLVGGIISEEESDLLSIMLTLSVRVTVSVGNVFFSVRIAILSCAAASTDVRSRSTTL